MCRQAHIIRRSRHHWRSQHHLPKANIIQKTHLCLSNDASPYGDMMHLLRKYDVARFTRNDAMFAIRCGEATHHSRSEHHWAKPNIICRRQTSFKKRTFVYQDKGSFFELSVPCGTISTPSVREAMLRIVKCLRA